MNSTIENKKFNLTFFFGACFISLLLLGAAGFFGYMSLKTTESGTTKVNQVCINQLRVSALNPKVVNNIVEVKVTEDDFLASNAPTKDSTLVQVNIPGPVNIESLVETASVVLATCVGYELREFCAGVECAVPGLSFTLVEKLETK